VNLRLKTKYIDFRRDRHETEGIFYESVHLLADNGARLDVKTQYPEKQTENDSYCLMEWSDNNIEAEKVLPFRGARRIQVNFDGKYSKTFDMTAEQLQSLHEIIALYTYLTNQTVRTQ
jgi:hypothetical protein